MQRSVTAAILLLATGRGKRLPEDPAACLRLPVFGTASLIGVTAPEYSGNGAGFGAAKVGVVGVHVGGQRFMHDDPLPGSPELRGDRQFRTTRWSLVLAARERAGADSRDALAVLCQTYWLPVYTFVRRHTANATDAQDLTQEFFCRLLQKDYLSRADQQFGHFRTFLLTAVQRFLSNERLKARAIKRGGGQCVLSLDFLRAEHEFAITAATEMTAEREFDRQWARQVLETVLDRLRAEYRDAGKEAAYLELKPLMVKSTDAEEYITVAERLGMSSGAVKTAVYRMRKRYRDLLLSEISQTVADAEETEDELRWLFQALG